MIGDPYTTSKLESKRDSGWLSWYAWRPVKDSYGNWHWLSHIYKRVIIHVFRECSLSGNELPCSYEERNVYYKDGQG